jgi:hypothetical protein
LKLIYGENIKCKVCESIFHMARGSHNFFAWKSCCKLMLFISKEYLKLMLHQTCGLPMQCTNENYTETVSFATNLRSAKNSNRN